MSRFTVGSRVRVIGGIAEYYRGRTIVVTDVIPHARGLSHLNRYRVLISDRTEDTFYEFQLGTADSETPGEESQKASA